MMSALSASYVLYRPRPCRARCTGAVRSQTAGGNYHSVQLQPRLHTAGWCHFNLLWSWTRNSSVDISLAAVYLWASITQLWKFSLFFLFLFRIFILIMLFLFLAVEESVSCENPGLPDNGYQILSKRLYLPGESLNFMCYQGYELIGEMTIKCILGSPSFWSGPLPMCRGKASHL